MERIKNRADLLAFAKTHPTWVLQRCRGVRFSSWWWMRENNKSGHTVHVDARSVSDKLLREHFVLNKALSHEFGNHTTYTLKP